MTISYSQNTFDFNTIKNSIAKYKAIDLFAGIGGIRLGFETVFQNEISFVFSSEIDKFAQTTYYANFGEIPHGEPPVFVHQFIVADFVTTAPNIQRLLVWLKY